MHSKIEIRYKFAVVIKLISGILSAGTSTTCSGSCCNLNNLMYACYVRSVSRGE